MEITTIEIKCIFPLTKKEPDVHFKTSGDHVSIEFHKLQGNMNKNLYTSIIVTSLVSHLFYIIHVSMTKIKTIHHWCRPTLDLWLRAIYFIPAYPSFVIWKIWINSIYHKESATRFYSEMLVKFFKFLRDPVILSKHTTVSKTKQSQV